MKPLQYAVPVALANRWTRVSAENWYTLHTPLVDGLPQRWRARLTRRLRESLAEPVMALQRSHRVYLKRVLPWVEVVHSLKASPVSLDASDAEICEAAERAVDECERIKLFARDVVEQGGFPYPLVETARRRGVALPEVGERVAPAVARMCCHSWWRRQLRRAHAKAVEGSAIALGYVHRRGDVYVSNETLERRAQQQRRNARTLEETTLENELGQQFTIAALAEKSVSNKAIRRGELITRIKGFESCAYELKHAAEFVTITCPSRMHAYLHTGEPNPKHDGTTPAEAQQYLCRVWARIRAELWRETADKRATPVYGFRIAEPHHDGCPHWHLILFAPDADMYWIRKSIREHALIVDGDEAGAAERRVRFESIVADKGSAVGYVIKYVAKNIDGFKVGEWKVENDLVGDASLNLAPRIEAWAATWRIRQFQQIGGPPVGVWREMRRIKSEQLADAPNEAQEAWLYAQRYEWSIKTPDVEGGEIRHVKLADFGMFTQALGGPLLPRKERPVQLNREQTGELTKYGEVAPPKAVGIKAAGRRFIARFIGSFQYFTTFAASAVVEAARHVWRVVSTVGSGVPRTRVNNCTRIHSHEFDDPERSNRKSPFTPDGGDVAVRSEGSDPGFSPLERRAAG